MKELAQGRARKPTRVLSAVVLLLLVTATSVGVSQYLARAYNYHPALGTPVAGRWYWPWAWVGWYGAEAERQPLLYRKALGGGLLGLAGGLFLYFIGITMYQRTGRGNSHLHGSAHWASKEEIEASGLMADGGVYVGGWQDGRTLRYLRHNGPEHILVFAPTRSGKGVGIVLPTLLSWPASVVVLDIKGENWSLTSGWRQRHAGSRVLRYAPGEPEDTVRFNPLAEVRLGTPYEVSDVQNLATMIVDPDGRGLNDHWAKTGHALLVGGILHCLYVERQRGGLATLAGVAGLLSDPARPIEAIFQEMLETEHTGAGVHPVVAASARDMLNKAENERSGVLSTAMSFLTLYRDPIVAQNTAVSDFTIRDLMSHDQPVSLYVVVGPNNKDRLKPLLRLLVNQIVRTLTEKMEFAGGRSTKHYRHRLLLLLDEFPSLGRLDVFQESMAYIAGYGIKALLIVQDLAQLYAAYGRDESIVSNCHVRVAYAPNKIETAELLSKLTGTTTVLKQSVSVSGKRLGPVLGQVQESVQEVARPLLTPDECMRLPGAQKASDPSHPDGKIVRAGDMLVMVAGHAPIYGRQILYFLDPVFQARARLLAPPTDRL